MFVEIRLKLYLETISKFQYIPKLKTFAQRRSWDTYQHDFGCGVSILGQQNQDDFCQKKGQRQEKLEFVLIIQYCLMEINFKKSKVIFDFK